MVCYKMKKTTKKNKQLIFGDLRLKSRNLRMRKLGVTDQTGILFKFHLFKTQL